MVREERNFRLGGAGGDSAGSQVPAWEPVPCKLWFAGFWKQSFSIRIPKQMLGNEQHKVPPHGLAALRDLSKSQIKAG